MCGRDQGKDNIHEVLFSALNHINVSKITCKIETSYISRSTKTVIILSEKSLVVSYKTKHTSKQPSYKLCFREMEPYIHEKICTEMLT